MSVRCNGHLTHLPVNVGECGADDGGLFGTAWGHGVTAEWSVVRFRVPPVTRFEDVSGWRVRGRGAADSIWFFGVGTALCRCLRAPYGGMSHLSPDTQRPERLSAHGKGNGDEGGGGAAHRAYPARVGGAGPAGARLGRFPRDSPGPETLAPFKLP